MSRTGTCEFLCATHLRTWKVVGGGDKGGVLVRQGHGQSPCSMAPGKSLSSEQLPERLATGAVVKELKLEGDRLHFELETGVGWGSQPSSKLSTALKQSS